MQTGAQGAQVAVEAFSRHLPRCPGIVDPKVKELSGDKYMDKYGSTLEMSNKKRD